MDPAVREALLVVIGAVAVCAILLGYSLVTTLVVLLVVCLAAAAFGRPS